MKSCFTPWVLGCLWTALATTFMPHLLTAGEDRYYEVEYNASTEPGELQMGVEYTLWVPGSATKLRGVIVHQHGCGTGACQGGATAAYDLHWQALAKKYDCALLGPSYQQAEEQNCRLWCDPRNGSGETFLRCLDVFAKQSGHDELKTVPWCLWGHSGGGYWSSLMQTLYPDRIVAIWLRSGTAFDRWEKGEIDKPEITPAVYQIPVMCNPGLKEKGDARFNGAYVGSRAMFQAYRAQGAPIGFAPDPLTSHQCGDSRYLAIPFFAACLEQRLPEKGSDTQELKTIYQFDAWLAPLEGNVAVPAGEYKGKANEAVWLPNAAVASAWSQYVTKGSTEDTTPPPAPTNIQTTASDAGPVTITWSAAADMESGLSQFVIFRDGKKIGKHPAQPVGRFGRALFQTMSYHDTPEKPLPEMKFVDEQAKPGEEHTYTVKSVNSVGLESE